MHRVHNFNAGPAALPLPVLEKVQSELLDFQNSGMSLLEHSHRGKLYEAVHNQAIADLKELLGVGDEHQVLFMGGGARSHFALIPMNLLAGKSADYLVTGTWATYAIKEAKKIGKVREAYTSAATNHDHVPPQGKVEVDKNAAYLHYTSNNTIYGTQFHYVPDTGGVPLVCDCSSDFLSRPVDAKKFGVLYAGAQKNLGPAGVVVLVIRKDLLERSADTLPDMFSYKKVAAENSLLNTPPVFAIYMSGLVLKHLKAMGGLGVVEKENRKKQETLYAAIDGSGGFYKAHAQKDSRSWMNVTFRLPSEELEGAFVKEAEKAELVGLKGHRSVGGIRASIYNAVPQKSVDALVAFMAEFKKKRG